MKYDLQCTNFEPDKTYNTTMYMQPAKTQVSLCIDHFFSFFLFTYLTVFIDDAIWSCSLYPGFRHITELRCIIWKEL